MIVGPKLALGLFVLGGLVLLQAKVHRTEGRFPAVLYSYDDGLTGGRSQVLDVRAIPGGWRMIFALQSGHAGYCGLGLAVGATTDAVMDVSRLHSLELELRNSRKRAVKVIALAHDPQLTRAGTALSYRYSEARLTQGAQGRCVVRAHDFSIATWWLDQGLVPATDTARRLDRLHALEFQVPASGNSTGVDTLEILAPRLLLAPSIPWGFVFGLWAVGLALLWFWWRGKRAAGVVAEMQPIAADVPAIPHPVPTSLRSESHELRERLVLWLREHYQESDLDADAVAKGTGIARDRLATLLKDGYGMAFKPFLNELRLTEAARLLKETDRSISEVAFAVGYNSHTHFTRVFRERYQRTPGEWREAELGRDQMPRVD